MEDFTGGLTEMFDLMQSLPANLFNIMHKAAERESMMSCSIDVRFHCSSSIVNYSHTRIHTLFSIFF